MKNEKKNHFVVQSTKTTFYKTSHHAIQITNYQLNTLFYPTVNARCTVINHTPSCSCEIGYTGDPFTNCVLKQGKSFIYSLILIYAFGKIKFKFKKKLTLHNVNL